MKWENLEIMGAKEDIYGQVERDFITRVAIISESCTMCICRFQRQILELKLGEMEKNNYIDGFD